MNKFNQLIQLLRQQINKFEKNINFFLGALLFLLTMSVYLFTLAPTITMEDSGELVSAAATLGIPHPSGYPLYTILGWLFTFIPLGTIAWRVNLLSAVFGALTISLLYYVIERVTKNKLVAFSGSLILAFSATFWSQCVVSKFYTLNSFFVVLLILVLLIWSEKRENKYLYWFSLLYGLSLTNHTMMLLLAPAYTAYILLTDWKIVLRWKLIGKMFGLFLLGLTVYIYIPWRAFQMPVFSWGPITTWRDVWVHITRGQYGDFSLLKQPPSKVGLIILFFLEIVKQFFAPTILLAAAGAIYLWVKNRPLAALSTIIFLLNSLGIILLRKFGLIADVNYTYRVYYLPAFAMVVLWLAVIIGFVYDWLGKTFKEKQLFFRLAIRGAVIAILIILPVSFFFTNFQRSDYSDFWLNYDFEKNVLASLEPNSIYVFIYDNTLQSDTQIFSLAYLQMVEHFRPDVTIISELNLFYKKSFFKFPASYFKLNYPQRQAMVFNLLSPGKDRPLYTNKAYVANAVMENKEKTDFYTVSNGYAYKVFPDLKAAKEAKVAGYLAPERNLSQVDALSEAPEIGLASSYYTNFAFYYLAAGQERKAKEYFNRAVEIGGKRIEYEQYLFSIYQKDWAMAQ